MNIREEVTTVKVEVVIDIEPTLEEAVGGWIEMISLKNGDQMIANGEGLLLGLPVNRVASAIVKKMYSG